ncbi:MAG: hypothetical protein WCV93_02465 [Candidatus Shapirobacteria bacterium]|jgi:hypothetical protein
MKRSVIKNGVILLLSLVVGWCLIGVNLGAKWGVIDDHAIMTFLGNDGKISVFEIPRIILGTEVGQYGKVNRFRPSFWLVYLIECSLWGNNPVLWYMSKFILFVFMVFTGIYLLEKWIGISMAVGIVLVTLLYPGWSDIWTRLGPAEIYGVLGTSMVLMGLYWVWMRGKSGIGYGCVFVGGLIALGTKENFFILLLPIWGLVVYKLTGKNKDWCLLVVALVLTGFEMWIWFGLLKYFSTNSYDLYGNSVETGGRLNNLINWIVRVYGKIPIFLKMVFTLITVFFGAVSLYIYRNNQKNWIEWWSVLKILLITVILGVIVIGSQVFFYNGNWPVLSRYDYPGILMLPMLLAVIFYMGKRLIEILFTRKWLDSLYTLVWLVAMALAIKTVGYGVIVEAGRNNAVRTRLFTDKVQMIVTEANKNKEKILLFESDDPGDYESVLSIKRFIEAYGVKNVLGFRWRGKSVEEYDSFLERDLSGSLINISKKGGSGFFDGFIAGELIEEKKCITISFMDDRIKISCDQIIK